MPMPFDIKEEVIVWAREHGQETVSTAGGLYFKIDYKNGIRARLIVILVKTLRELGADKGYFKSSSFKDTLIKYCFAPKHIMGRGKHANATQCILNELDIALIQVFGTESDYYKNNGKTRNLKEQKSESEKAAEKEHAKVADTEKPAKKAEKPFVKIFDPNRNTGEPGVIDNPDPELDEFLGFTK
jgi:hypothetical protein